MKMKTIAVDPINYEKSMNILNTVGVFKKENILIYLK